MRRAAKLILLWALLLLSATALRGPLEGQDKPAKPGIEELRRDYAMRYFEVGPHVALARRMRDEGRDFAAILTLETARRLFGYDEVDRAFIAEFLGGTDDLSPERLAALRARVKEAPGDPEILRELMLHHLLRDDLEPARQYLARLALAAPDEVEEHLYAYGRFRGKESLDWLPGTLAEFIRDHPDAPVSIALRSFSSPPETAKTALLAASEKHPESAIPHYALGVVCEEMGDLDAAEGAYLQAAELRPDCELYRGEAARFLIEVRKDGPRALPHIYATHFLNPYYFSDHRDATVAQIAKIGLRSAAKKMARLRRDGSTLGDMAGDEDPLVVLSVLRLMGTWEPEYVEPVAGLLAHDLDQVATEAARLLAQNLDESFEPRLDQLLQSEDLRVRARALSVAVGLRGERAHPFVLAALQSDCQLQRHEAIGALFLAGGEPGRRLAVAHRKREKSEFLRGVIDEYLARWKGVLEESPPPEEPEGGLVERVVRDAPEKGDRVHVPHGCRAVDGARWQEVEVRGATLVVPTRVRHGQTGIELILISPGWYVRGASKGGSGAPPESPRHEVRVTRAFYLGVFEVVNDQYRAVHPDHDSGKANSGESLNGDRQPAVNVSFTEAADFCARFGFRLPTEGEWEFACRAGTAGGSYGPTTKVAVHSDFMGELFNSTREAGTREPNSWGLHDMLGNAWEWCADWYGRGEYERCREGAIDPGGPPSGESRIFRGGSFDSSHCRASERRWARPGYRRANRGFRVAMDPVRRRRVEGLEFVWVPPGSFRMSGEGGTRPVHRVEIADGFWISTTEVTNEVYDRILPGRTDLRSSTGAQRPAVYVSWHDARRFCSGLSEKAEGEFRLPSEAEWEYAARTGGAGEYCFGDDPSLLDEYAWYEDNHDYDSGSREVATKSPSRWGIYDLHGNVREWCEDRWHETYAGAPADGSAWTSGRSPRRVLRGGCVSQSGDWLRAIQRDEQDPDRQDWTIGFRLVATFPTGR